MMLSRQCLEYKNYDGSYSVRIPTSVLTKMHECCVASFPYETGGILIGSYSEDCSWANITQICGASKNSIRRRRSFVRLGQDYLPILSNLWDKNQYYLGEWHFHPRSSAEPSVTDINTMMKLSHNRELHCPEPLLIVVGGEPQKWDLSVSVFSNQSKIVLSLFPPLEE